MAMTRAEIISAIAKKAGVTKKDTDAVIRAFCDLTIETVKKEELLILPKFGTFSMSERKDREGINPSTHERMTIPGGNVLHFKMSGVVKELLKQSYVN